MNRWNVVVQVDAELQELLCLVGDVVLRQVAVHVELAAEALPGVGGSVSVDLEVTVKDLVDGLLCRDFKHVVVLGEHVDESDLAWLGGKAADRVAAEVTPPRDLEGDFAKAGIGLC